MTSSTRRTLLAGLAASASLPLLALPIRLAARDRRISFPESPITLRRELERSLGENASLKVVRDWRCVFSLSDKGASVRGAQLRCDVDAPENLAALARMEQDRKVTGLFPLALDSQGLISSSNEARPHGIAAAVEEASAQIAQASLAAADKRDARIYFAEIGKRAAALVSSVPRDLFYPEVGTRSERRAIPLDGGLEGSYEVSIEAQARGSDGLLAFSERRIVTRIGETSRIARERWSLVS